MFDNYDLDIRVQVRKAFDHGFISLPRSSRELTTNLVREGQALWAILPLRDAQEASPEPVFALSASVVDAGGERYRSFPSRLT